MTEQSTAGRPLLAIDGLVKRFGEAEVLRGVSLSVEKGEVLALIGPSGSGKTTLLRCINLIEEYQAGSITVDGERIGYRDAGGRRLRLPERAVSRQRAHIGMVFQSYNLFPHMTATSNIVLGQVRVLGRKREEARAIARQWLERVGLSDKADLYPYQLSGGQQQRVAIARALAMDPKLMLLDEVTSALDPELVGEVLAVIQDLARSGMTMLVVSHEMLFVREVATRAVFMEEGNIVEGGTPAELFGAPKTQRLQLFLRRFRSG
jgi:polar amino acid transport system ATP-binding protein